MAEADETVHQQAAEAAPGAPQDGQPSGRVAPLLELRDGLPAVVETEAALEEAVQAFARGTGPVAIDAERASGYRYSARAYLVQLRREGSGTALIDPIAFEGLESLNDALGDAEWILHAATQDLACLAEVGLRPVALFDTELAGRLLGYPRVGLATLVEAVLGRSLRKEHSAVDWSTRPLPEPWLEYAALDVEALVELRARLGAELEETGKAEWARQEFEHLVHATRSGSRQDPWRRTSGVHRASRASSARSGSGALGDAGRNRRPARRHPGADPPRCRDRRGRQRVAQGPPDAARAEGLPRPWRGALREPVGRRVAACARASRGRAAAGRSAVRRSATAPRLG